MLGTNSESPALGDAEGAGLGLGFSAAVRRALYKRRNKVGTKANGEAIGG